MRGVVSEIVPDGTYGQISAEDGQRFSYWTSEVRNGQVKVGQTVEFQMWEGQPVDIFVVNNPPPPNAAPPQRAAMPQQRAAAAAAPAAYAAAPAGYAAAPVGYAAAPAGFARRHARGRRDPDWARLLDQTVHLAVGPRLAPAILAARRAADRHWQRRTRMDSHSRPAYSLVLLWGSICLGFKRFHDLGYPGWYSLVYLVPFLAAAVIFSVGLFAVRVIDMAWLLAEILGGIGFLIGLAQLILVYVRVGQEGPNQYGPDPLAV